MDNGLIFPYRRRTAPINPVVLSARIPLSRSLRGETVGASARPHAGAVSVLTGVTQEGSPTRAMVVPGQVRRPRDRQIRLSHRLRHDADKKWVILCCREKHRREVLAARTPNRLRWSGREYQGDRENRG